MQQMGIGPGQPVIPGQVPAVVRIAIAKNKNYQTTHKIHIYLEISVHCREFV